MKIKPLGNLVLLKRIDEGEQTRDGIIIPDSAKEKSQEAEVVEVGSGKRTDSGELIPIEVKKGDKVIIPGYGGTSVKINDAEHVLLSADTVLAVVVE